VLPLGRPLRLVRRLFAHARYRASRRRARRTQRTARGGSPRGSCPTGCGSSTIPKVSWRTSSARLALVASSTGKAVFPARPNDSARRARRQRSPGRRPPGAECLGACGACRSG
jgi:hypothetical protein